MTQIIVWLIVILLIYLIVKISSFIWRLVGFLVIVFLLWTFRDTIFTGVQHWVSDFDMSQLSHYFEQAKDFVVEKSQQFVDWFQQLLK